jgi:tRNA(Arg) A34 adenosine deaminase TadA
MEQGELSEGDAGWLRRSFAVARRAVEGGNHAFGAVLVAADGALLLEGENSVVTERDCTGHAETNLLRAATRRFDAATLAGATLYASTEPCVMCAGALYWSGVGRLVYGLSGARLRVEVAGAAETPELGSRAVLGAGRRPVAVLGPCLEDEALAVHGLA